LAPNDRAWERGGRIHTIANRGSYSTPTLQQARIQQLKGGCGTPFLSAAFERNEGSHPVESDDASLASQSWVLPNSDAIVDAQKSRLVATESSFVAFDCGMEPSNQVLPIRSCVRSGHHPTSEDLPYRVGTQPVADGVKPSEHKQERREHQGQRTARTRCQSEGIPSVACAEGNLQAAVENPTPTDDRSQRTRPGVERWVTPARPTRVARGRRRPVARRRARRRARRLARQNRARADRA